MNRSPFRSAGVCFLLILFSSQQLVAQCENLKGWKKKLCDASHSYGRIPIPDSSSGAIDWKTPLYATLAKAVNENPPLYLDQKSALPFAVEPQDFHPIELHPVTLQDFALPLAPGDYKIASTGYCTEWSIHRSGYGAACKLAVIQGQQREALSALMTRGTLSGVNVGIIQSAAWAIQSGLPLSRMDAAHRGFIHQLIPEYENALEGDYLNQAENLYNKFRFIPGIPHDFNTMLAGAGDVGKAVLQVKRGRDILARAAFADDTLPDKLYEPQPDGLPRILPDLPRAQAHSSPWSQVAPGLIARFTILGGNMSRNVFEFRITPQDAWTVTTGAGTITRNPTLLDVFGMQKYLSRAMLAELGLGAEAGPPGWALDALLIGYMVATPAQDLIVLPMKTPGNGGGNQNRCPKLPDNLNASNSWGNKTLTRHFNDHGSDFGAASEQEYAQMAYQFLKEAITNGFPTKISANGTIRIYNPSTNTLGWYNSDGTTQSFFKPNPSKHNFQTNQDYWNNQQGKSCKW